MIEKSTLNSGQLPDGTGGSQKPAGKSPEGVSAADIKRGYTTQSTERIPTWDPYIDGGENEVGDPWSYGGMCGRPRGSQR